MVHSASNVVARVGGGRPRNVTLVGVSTATRPGLRALETAVIVAVVCAGCIGLWELVGAARYTRGLIVLPSLGKSVHVRKLQRAWGEGKFPEHFLEGSPVTPGCCELDEGKAQMRGP